LDGRLNDCWTKPQSVATDLEPGVDGNVAGKGDSDELWVFVV
jgi:hypothetical protein